MMPALSAHPRVTEALRQEINRRIRERNASLQDMSAEQRGDVVVIEILLADGYRFAIDLPLSAFGPTLALHLMPDEGTSH
jgi:hypothetical protein